MRRSDWKFPQYASFDVTARPLGSPVDVARVTVLPPEMGVEKTSPEKSVQNTEVPSEATKSGTFSVVATTTGWHALSVQPPPRQSCAHPPQLCGSLVVSMQPVAHAVSRHVQEPMLQSGVG
jgi:hypothetical protein